MSSLDVLDHRIVESLYKDGVIQRVDLHYYLMDAILSRNVDLLITVTRIGLIDPSPHYRVLQSKRGFEILSAIDILARYPQDIETTYKLIHHSAIPFSSGQTDLEGLVRVGLRFFDSDVRHKCIKSAVEILTTVSGIDLSLVTNPQIRRAVIDTTLYLPNEYDHPIVAMATKSLLFRHYVYQIYRLDSLFPLPKLKAPPKPPRHRYPPITLHDAIIYGVGSFLSIRDLASLDALHLYPMVEAQYRIRLTEVLETIPMYPPAIEGLIRMRLINREDLSLLSRIGLLTRNVGLVVYINKVAHKIVRGEIERLIQTVPWGGMISITDLVISKLSLLKKRKVDLLTPILSYYDLTTSRLPLTNSNVSWKETLEYPAITNLEIASRNLALAESVITGAPYIATKLAVTNYVRGYTDTPPNDERKVLKYRLTRLRELYRRWGIP
jgi:hypothetical protein